MLTDRLTEPDSLFAAYTLEPVMPRAGRMDGLEIEHYPGKFDG
jgi:hypothetical protein